MGSCSRSIVRFAVSLFGLGLFALACQANYTLDGSSQSGAFFEPGGAAITVNVTSAPPGQAIAFAPVPTSITVMPSSVTADPSGNAQAYAIVPYGSGGVVVASAPFSTPKEIPVAAAPLTLCTPTITASDAGDLGTVGQVYTISVQALTSDAGSCANPGDAGAPAGVPIVITTAQPSSAATSVSASSDAGASTASATPAVTALTNPGGLATTNVQLSWGANVLVQATAGGGIAYTSLAPNANPAMVTCLSWTQEEPGIYQIQARAIDGPQPLPAATIALSVIAPAANAGAITPASPLTDEAGVGTAFIVIPDASAYPVTVEAVLGSSAMIASLDGGPMGTMGICP
jgi:hypothetical protein